ncbi:MAG: hypothetical protein ACUVSU_02075 [Aggregatilineaceae bacterium]
MPKRPDVFDRQILEEALREVGCPDSCIAPTISNYRLFVPLVLSTLGRDRIEEIVNAARAELGLGEQQTAWRTSLKYIVAWAKAEIEAYKQRRETSPAFEENDSPQLRLL